GGEQTSLRLVVENLTDSIFAISLRISYRDSILTFAGVAGAESGDFFGADAIQFAQDTLSVLHITISRIQGQTEVNGSGTICTFRFVGRNAGNCVMEILPDQLEFYDSAGRTIEVPNLEIKTASVHVI
ncbi:cohesin domain-containing protein, partial [bacterium]|nr:cohesin domain-containing protein [bacterium]